MSAIMTGTQSTVPLARVDTILNQGIQQTDNRLEPVGINLRTNDTLLPLKRSERTTYVASYDKESNGATVLTRDKLNIEKVESIDVDPITKKEENKTITETKISDKKENAIDNKVNSYGYKPQTKVSNLWPVPDIKNKMIDEDFDKIKYNEFTNVKQITDINLTYKYGNSKDQIPLPMDKGDKYLLKGSDVPVIRPIKNYRPLRLNELGGVYGQNRRDYNAEIVRRNKEIIMSQKF